MKTYEKPKLMALSLSGNDLLCGTCKDADIRLYKHGSNPDVKEVGLELDWLVGDDDGIVERGDLSYAFGSEESCDMPIETYCKFNGANTVAWS